MTVAETQLPGYVTVIEVARRLKVTPSRVRQLLMELREKCSRELGYLVGTTRLFSASDVNTLEEWRQRTGEFEESD